MRHNSSHNGIYWISEEDWVGQRQDSSGAQLPNALTIPCPVCGGNTNFAIGRNSYDASTKTAVVASRCAGCSGLVRFVAVWSEQLHPSRPSKPAQFFAVVSESKVRATLDFDGFAPERVIKAYRATIQSYNSQNYDSAAVSARRVLEGIFKLRVGARNNEKLPSLIQSAVNDPVLKEQLTDLATSIKDGGNLGAHFDLEKEVDQTIAESIIELVEFLIIYFYQVPKRISLAENLIATRGGEAPSDP